MVGMSISALVLQSVDFLQQVTQSVDEELLLEGLEQESAVGGTFDNAKRCVTLTWRVTLYRYALQQHLM